MRIKLPQQLSPPTAAAASNNTRPNDSSTASKACRKPVDIFHFDRLPNSALVPVKVLAAVLGQGKSTVWRKCHEEAGFPPPVHFGPGCTRFSVGAVRAYLLTKTALSTPRRSKTPKVNGKASGPAGPNNHGSQK